MKLCDCAGSTSALFQVAPVLAQRDLRATSGRQFIDPIDSSITFMYLGHKPYGAILFTCTKVSRLTRQSQTGSA